MILDVAILKGYLAPDRAKLLDSADAPFFPDKEIHISWGGIPRTALQDCLDILGDKCWATQFQAAGILYTVTDPVVGTVPFKGMFRNVLGSIRAVEEPAEEARKNEPRYTILQTIRQGWATAINLDEGRLTGNGIYEDLPKEAVLVFPNMAGDKVQAIAAAAVAQYPTTDTPPVPFSIRGVTAAGTWYLHRTRYRHADDGSGVIELKYSWEPETVDKTIETNRFQTVVETFTHDDDPLTAKTDLDTKMASATGKTKTGEIHQDDDNIWVNVTRVTTPAAVQPVETVQTTDAFKSDRSATDKNVLDAATAPSPPAALAPVTGQVVMVKKVKTETPGVSDITAKIVEATSVPAAETALTTDAFKATRNATDVNAVSGAAAPTPPAALAQVTGQVVSETRKKTEFPSKDNITASIVVATPVAGAETVQVTDAFRTSRDITDRQIPSATAPSTPPAALAPVTGQVVTLKVAQTDFPGTVNKVASIVEAVNVPAAETTLITDAFSAKREATDRNAATGAAAPTPPSALSEVSGAIATERRVKTEFPGKDNITSELVVARSVTSAIERTIINALERSATVENRGAASGDAPPTPTLPMVSTQVAGQAITITVEKSQFPDKFTKTKQVTEAIAVDSGWVASPGKYGSTQYKDRIVENDTLANIATAISDTTTGYEVSCRLSATQYYQRYTAHLIASLIVETAHQTDWSNFSEEATGDYKYYVVGKDAYKVLIDWGIKQTNSHAAAAAFVTGKGNPKISSINGGRHFKATYLTIKSKPVLI